jgi:hypothetical protein
VSERRQFQFLGYAETQRSTANVLHETSDITAAANALAGEDQPAALELAAQNGEGGWTRTVRAPHCRKDVFLIVR